MAEPGEVCDDDDPMGLVEGCIIAMVLFQQGADQSPSRKKCNGLHYESRKSPGKRKRISLLRSANMVAAANLANQRMEDDLRRIWHRSN